MKEYMELRKEELKKRGAKGFTLMEMLIVVAIIAVLIAIAIPVFTSQLENSREATDAANLRSAYAEIAASGMTENDGSTSVEPQQQIAGWSNAQLVDQKIGEYKIGDGASSLNAKTSGSNWTVSWNSASQKVDIS